MFEETFFEDDEDKITERFTRFEKEDVEQLRGLRIKGKGKIEASTNAEGELHPAFVTTDQDEIIAAHELPYQDFDNRHNDLPF